MKIIFISGVIFGSRVLSKLLESNFKVSAIFSYSEEKKNSYSDYYDFDILAKKYKIKNYKINNINDSKNIEIIKSINPDLILVMGWSQLLKTEILHIPSIGIIGSHPTELPKYRGRAPIPWTILKELQKSALTFFWIEEGTDNGDILDQRFFYINEQDDAESIYENISRLGEEMIVENLQLIQKNIIKKSPQDESKFIENWPKRVLEDGVIDWNDKTKNILKLIRATTFPYPGAYTFFKNKKLIIWKAKAGNDTDPIPGKILKVSENNLIISTMDSSIIVYKALYDDNSVESFQNSFVNALGMLMNNS